VDGGFVVEDTRDLDNLTIEQLEHLRKLYQQKLFTLSPSTSTYALLKLILVKINSILSRKMREASDDAQDGKAY
jgi:hypothetical protein